MTILAELRPVLWTFGQTDHLARAIDATITIHDCAQEDVPEAVIESLYALTVAF